jgi:hypothetical protein
MDLRPNSYARKRLPHRLLWLFLPQLLEEKTEAVRRYVRRQDARRPRGDQQIELAE